MPDDYEQLKRTIQEGERAAEQLRKLLAEQKRDERPRLKLIRGGMVGGAIWSGVEWLFDPRKIAAALAAAAISTGAVISDQPGSPGSDPPQAVNPPASVSPSVTPRPTVNPTPRPPRTSPLRTLGRSGTPVAAPTTPRKPVPSRTKTPRTTETPTPIATPVKTPSLTQTVVPTSVVDTPKLTAPITTCVVDLLGVELCLPLG